MKCRIPKGAGGLFLSGLLALAPSLVRAQTQSEDRIFNEPRPQGLTTQAVAQTAAALGDFIVMYSLWPDLYPEAAQAKKAFAEVLERQNLPVTEQEREETIRRLVAQGTPESQELMEKIRASRLYTQEEKNVLIIQAADEVNQARYRAMLAGRSRGLIPRTVVHWMRVAGSTFFFADGAGRLYLWYWANVNPTVSPAGTYLLQNELGWRR